MFQDQHSTGLQGAFLEHRGQLLRFLVARGAGDDAEDLLQEVWLKISAVQAGPIASPLAYLYRVADTLMIDRFRSMRQATVRNRAWADLRSGDIPGVSDAPSAERAMLGREYLRQVAELLARLEPPRVGEVFRRHKIDGIPQRQIAEEFGVGLSTVEGDLRKAYKALADFREKLDEA